MKAGQYMSLLRLRSGEVKVSTNLCELQKKRTHIGTINSLNIPQVQSKRIKLKSTEGGSLCYLHSFSKQAQVLRASTASADDMIKNVDAITAVTFKNPIA